MSTQTLESEILETEIKYIANLLRQVKIGIVKILQTLEETGAPILIVDENASNLTKISDVLSTYEGAF